MSKNSTRNSGNKPVTQPPATPTPDVTAPVDTPVTEDTVVEPTASEPITESVVATEPPATETEPVIDTVVIDPLPVAATVETVYDFIKLRHRGFNEVDASPLLIDVVDSMARYVEAMAPTTSIDPATGRMYQQQLYNTFLKAIGAPDGEHRLALDAITWFIKQHNNAAFADRYSARFFELLKISKESRMCFEAILNLFIVTADVSTRRDALRRLNMRSIIQTLPTLRYQQLLLDYYTGY